MLEYQSQILLIITCLLFSGFFCGLEIAYISRDKLNFEIKSSPKSFFGKRKFYLKINLEREE